VFGGRRPLARGPGAPRGYNLARLPGVFEDHGMRSSHLDLANYDSDKIVNRYLDRYDPVFAPWLEQPIVLLELGVHRGGSLRLWRDYFPLGTIVGIDLRLPPGFQDNERIRLFEGSQTDLSFLTGVAAQTAPAGFDLIIDDASHLGEATRTSFWHLFDHHLKPGGIYAIEDWGTGYWDDWPDGKGLDLAAQNRSGLIRRLATSRLWPKPLRRRVYKASWSCHRHGMVGFIKQLVDEQAAADVTQGSARGTPGRVSRFESMTIAPSIVFVKKANLAQPDEPGKKN
jgi:hypothetical protein